MSKVKCSRIARSSSLGDIGNVDQLRHIEPPVARLVKRTTPLQKPLIISKACFLKPSDQPRRKILTIGSPERGIINSRYESNDHERVGGFCENCHSCKKKIGEKDDIFMYSYLRAFCSPKCRDKQISLDKKVDKGTNSNGTKSQWKFKAKKGHVALAQFV